jgi:hypothetical protein
MSDKNRLAASLGSEESGEQRLDKFLVGKSIYLRPPSIEDDVFNGDWHNWFNDIDNTRFLIHGVFPVKKEEQAALVKGEMSKTTTLLLCIISRETDSHVGIISLKNISLLNRNAEIGIVMAPNRIVGTMAFEAMAVLIKHAFYRLILDLLYAGQHEGLWKWVNSLLLLGFKVDGFRSYAGFRDREHYGIFHTSVSAVDFLRLEKDRGGDILNPSPMDILRLRPRKNPASNFRVVIQELNSQLLDPAIK